MEIGIGLPGHAPWTDGRQLVEFARRADARGFSALGVSDRLLWTSPEPLVALAAAAGATARIGLITSVLLAPLHTNHLLFAKAVLTLDQLAGPNRLRLGLAAGFRPDDFTASGVDYATRGKQFTALLNLLDDACNDRVDIGLRPATPGGPPMLFGGTSKAALRRIATRGTGWIAGTASVRDLEEFIPEINQEWVNEGRAGTPRVVASVMYALGPDAHGAVSRAISSYHEFGASLGAAIASSIAAVSIAGTGTEGFTRGFTTGAIVAIVAAVAALAITPGSRRG
ncbi:LLM class flavin-dependent oxidoreductase [Micromonospora sp. NBC_01412]|uniref:LLM class flavin-dependent oxidoreductase n=1 Tax=Micromonospora sp. NBC_01412 TaxID=2903590 RepID=UPI00324A56C4